MSTLNLPYGVGDRVKVSCGTYAGDEGVVTRMTPKRIELELALNAKRALFPHTSLSFLGQQAAGELEGEDPMALEEGNVIAMGMHDSVLSGGAAQTIVDRGMGQAVNTATNPFPDGQQPVLQVLGIEANDEEDPGQYSMVLSDGQLSIYGLLNDGHVALVESGQLAKFSIVKINRCVVGKAVDGDICLAVLQLEVVHDASYSGEAKLGKPTHKYLPQLARVLMMYTEPPTADLLRSFGLGYLVGH